MEITMTQVIITFISGFTSIYFGIYFFDVSLKKLNYIILLVLLFLLTITTLVIPQLNLENQPEVIFSFLKIATSLILMSFMYIQGLKLDAFSAFLGLGVFFVISITYQILVLLPLVILKINYLSYLTQIEYLYIITLLGFIIYFRCSIKKLRIYILHLVDINLIDKFKIFSNLLLLLLVCIYILSITAGIIRTEYSNMLDIALYLLLLLVVVILGIYSLFIHLLSKKKIKEMEDRHILSEVHNDYILTLNNFAHNYNNTMAIIKAFVDNEELSVDMLRHELNNILDWNIKNSIFKKIKFLNLPDVTIATVLSIKYEDIEKEGINLLLDVEGDKPISLNTKDLVDTFSITLDNAVEAVSKLSGNKTIYIKLEFNEHQFYYHIKNSYVLDNFGNILKSEKGHNLGLFTLIEIAKHNSNYEVLVDNKKNIREFNVVVKIKTLE